MTRHLTFVVLTVAAFAISPAAFGDIVSGGGGSWQTWEIGNLNQNNRPFWDGLSSDGSEKNIGYCLTNSGNCNMAGGPGVLPYWGKGTGTSGYADFKFSKVQSSSNVALLIEIAGNMEHNTFGWYDKAAPSILHPLFDGSAGTGDATFYTPSASYGFYLSGPGGLFKSGVDGENFALFMQNPQEYWLGIEDLPYCGSDKDYNDVVVKISMVPDSGATLMLLGGALIGLETLRRRFRA